MPIRRARSDSDFADSMTSSPHHWFVQTDFGALLGPMPDDALAATVLIVLVGAWWFWPRQRPDIYKNYVAIYQELKQRRDIAEDHATWTEFVTRSRTQLAETVPWLEEKAKSGDREKSLLLYAGRDLQELLELPRTSKSPHQKRLDAFFEQLQAMYGSK